MNPPLLNSDPIGADEIVKVAPSQGKGLGLFTTRSVAPGQLLVKEKPLVKVRMALIFIRRGQPDQTLQFDNGQKTTM